MKKKQTHPTTTSYPAASSGIGAAGQSAARKAMLCGKVVLPRCAAGGIGSGPSSCSHDAGKYDACGTVRVTVSRLRFFAGGESSPSSLPSSSPVGPSLDLPVVGACIDHTAIRRRHAASMSDVSISTPTTKCAPWDCAVDRRDRVSLYSSLNESANRSRRSPSPRCTRHRERARPQRGRWEERRGAHRRRTGALCNIRDNSRVSVQMMWT